MNSFTYLATFSVCIYGATLVAAEMEMLSGKSEQELTIYSASSEEECARTRCDGDEYIRIMGLDQLKSFAGRFVAYLMASDTARFRVILRDAYSKEHGPVYGYIFSEQLGDSYTTDFLIKSGAKGQLHALTSKEPLTIRLVTTVEARQIYGALKAKKAKFALMQLLSSRPYRGKNLSRGAALIEDWLKKEISELESADAVDRS